MDSNKHKFRSTYPRVLRKRKTRKWMGSCKLQRQKTKSRTNTKSHKKSRKNEVLFDKSGVFTRTIDLVWLGLFWAFVIVVMEKFKWVAAKLWGQGTWYIFIGASLAIIIGEVFKYTAAKRLYRLFPWLSEFVNLK